MEPIRVGQRVRVVSRELVHYRQCGTVIRPGADGGYYVHLDYDHDRPDATTFFHAEELEGVEDHAPQPDVTRGEE